MVAVMSERRRSVADAVAEASTRARERGGDVLLVWSIAIREAPDPVAWFAAADPSGPRMLWHRPQRGFALVGAGEALTASDDGPERFAAVGRALSAAMAGAVCGGDSEAVAGPVALGGFAFDPLRPRGDEWDAFPSSVVTVPRALLRIEHGRATLSVTVRVGPFSDPGEVSDALDREVGRWRRTRGFDPVCVEPPAPIARREAPPPAEWKRAVARSVADVRVGRLDKVVLARSERVVVAGAIDVPATLLRMRAANPSAVSFAFAQPGAVFLGASPETLVKMDGNRFETTPLAGSIARGASPEEDAVLATRLLRSAKDRHEHEVVVGAILQALDPVALELASDPGAPVVVTNRTVQHLATPIRGRTRPGVGVLELVQRLHPTPAVGGYPTEAALATIREREGFDRGWYAGPVGWVDADGGEFAIGIRSALVSGDAATLYAGCGIVGDSDPDQEYEETRLKLLAIGASLGAA